MLIYLSNMSYILFGCDVGIASEFPSYVICHIPNDTNQTAACIEACDR